MAWRGNKHLKKAQKNAQITYPERIKHKRQIADILKVVGQTVGEIWVKHKNAGHESFLKTCSHYVGAALKPERIENAHLPTKDENIIHTPIAKSIDRTVQRQIAKLKSTNQFDEVKYRVEQMFFNITMMPAGINLLNEIHTVIRLIWQGADLQYHYDKDKQNSQLYSYLVSLIGASIANICGIDENYSISDEVKIPVTSGRDWHSAAAVGMGMDCFRTSQSDCPMAQLKLMLDTYHDVNFSDHVKEDKERMLNTSGRVTLASLGKEKSIITENYILNVDEMNGDFKMNGLHVTDRNGFGNVTLCQNIDKIELAGGMLRRFGSSLMSRRSLTYTSDDKNAFCNIRMLSTGMGDTHDMKIAFMGAYNKGNFNAQTGLPKQQMLKQQFLH